MRAPTVILLLCAAGCSTTQTVGYPAEYVSMKGPTHVWVTRSDKSVMELSNPQIKGQNGDTLVGFSGAGEYTEMPVSDVQLMRAKVSAPGRTAILAGAAAIGAALAVSALMGDNTSTTTCYDRTTGGTMPCPPPAATSGTN